MNDEVKKVFFIVNRLSGTGFKAELETAIRRRCEAHALECGVAYTERPAHATALATRAVDEGYGMITAVGGDGTVNEVAQGLLHTPASMGIIPTGSGNGLARHLGIPVSPNSALDCLFNSDVIAMDTFRINGRLSLNVSGIGFDGYIAGLFGTKKNRGLQGYTRLVLNEFMHFPEFEVRISHDDAHVATKAFVVAIANSSQYGNNAKIAPSASVRDGFLDISILKKIPPYRLDVLYAFFSGTVDQSAFCESIRVRDTLIQLDHPLAWHIDGEPAGKADRFKIEMIPASLNMLTPSERV